MSTVNLSKEQLKALMREVQLENQPQRSQETAEDHVSHVLSCPNCLPLLMKDLERRKNDKAYAPYACSDCDLPFTVAMQEKIDVCPRCGSNKGYKR